MSWYARQCMGISSWRSARRFPAGYFPFVMASVQGYVVYNLFSAERVGVSFASWHGWLRAGTSVFTVWLFFQLVSVGTRRSVWGHRVGMFGACFVYSLLIAYVFAANDWLEWSTLAENWANLTSKNAFEVVIANLDPEVMVDSAAVLLLLFLIEWRYRPLARHVQSRPIVMKTVAFAAYFVVSFIPFSSYDPIMNFARTIPIYYFDSSQISIPKETYPFYTSLGDKLSGRFAAVARPKYVFLIMVESFNAQYVGRKGPNGQSMTPFLDSLGSTAVIVDRFYGNSIQTARGHFATFFSQIPSLAGIEYLNYPTLRAESLGDLMTAAGYFPYFVNGYAQLNYDLERDYLLTHGYPWIESIDPYLTPADRDKEDNFGVIDEVFYYRFFDRFDQVIRATGNAAFVTLTTIASHFPFEYRLLEHRWIYPEPKTLPQKYSNAIHMIDRGLRQFFVELDNRGISEKSLVVITGDHAYPLGENRFTHSEVGYFEESFRIPLYIIWKGRLTPRRIPGPHSQLDIAPTILDLIGYSPGLESSTVMGDSIFRDDQDRPVHLVQPYARHYMVVLGSTKLRLEAVSNTLIAYDLAKDPNETRNCLQDLPVELQSTLESELHRMRVHQQALRNNQLMPPRP